MLDLDFVSSEIPEENQEDGASGGRTGDVWEETEKNWKPMPSATQQKIAHATDYYLKNAEDYWGQGTLSYVRERVPIASTVTAAMEFTRLRSAAKAIEAGKETDDDIYTVAQHLAKQQYESGKGMTERGVDLLTSLPGMLVEWLTAGGPAKAVASRVTSRMGSGLVQGAAQKLVSGAVRTAIQPSTGTAIAGQLVEHTPQGEVKARSLPGAVGRGLTQAAIQNVINEFSGVFNPKQPGSFLKDVPKSFAGAIIGNELTKTGLYRILGEGQGSDLANAMTGEEKMKAIERLAPELIVFGSLESIMHAVPNMASRFAQLRKSGVKPESPRMVEAITEAANESIQATQPTQVEPKSPAQDVQPVPSPDVSLLGGNDVTPIDVVPYRTRQAPYSREGAGQPFDPYEGAPSRRPLTFREAQELRRKGIKPPEMPSEEQAAQILRELTGEETREQPRVVPEQPAAEQVPAQQIIPESPPPEEPPPTAPPEEPPQPPPPEGPPAAPPAAPEATVESKPKNGKKSKPGAKPEEPEAVPEAVPEAKPAAQEAAPSEKPKAASKLEKWAMKRTRAFSIRDATASGAPRKEILAEVDRLVTEGRLVEAEDGKGGYVYYPTTPGENVRPMSFEGEKELTRRELNEEVRFARKKAAMAREAAAIKAANIEAGVIPIREEYVKKEVSYEDVDTPSWWADYPSSAEGIAAHRKRQEDWLAERAANARRSEENARIEEEEARKVKNKAAAKMARRGKGAAKEYEQEAIDRGWTPEDVHMEAERLYGLEKAVQEELTSTLKQARKRLKRHGVSDRAIASAEDRNNIRGIDEVAEDLMGPFQALKVGMEDDSELLFRLLKSDRTPYTMDDAYKDALKNMGTNPHPRSVESPPIHEVAPGVYFHRPGEARGIDLSKEQAQQVAANQAAQETQGEVRPPDAPETPRTGPINQFEIVATQDALLDHTNYIESRTPYDPNAAAVALTQQGGTVTGKFYAGDHRVNLEEHAHHLARQLGFNLDPASMPDGAAEGFRQFFNPDAPLNDNTMMEGFGQWMVRRSEGNLDKLTPEQKVASDMAEDWVTLSGMKANLDRIRDLWNRYQSRTPAEKAAGLVSGTGRPAKPHLEPGETVQSWASRLNDWFQDNIKDSLSVLRRAGADKAERIFSRLMNADKATADSYASEGWWSIVDGKRTKMGPSDNEVISSLNQEDMQPFGGPDGAWKASVFAVARHVIDEHSRHGMLAEPHPFKKKYITSGPREGDVRWEAVDRTIVSADQLKMYQELMDEFQKDPEFVKRATEYADKLTAGFNASRRLLATPDVHRLNAEQVEHEIRLRPTYIPTDRVLGEFDRATIKTRKRGERDPNITHARSGSGQQIVDPWISYKERQRATAFLFNMQMRKNAIAEFLMLPGMARWGIPFEAEGATRSDGGKRLSEILDTAGMPREEADRLVKSLGAMVGDFEYAPWPTDGTKPTWHWIGPDGKETNFRIADKAFYDLITGQQGDDSNATALIRAAKNFWPIRKSAELIRVGATKFSIGFQGRNIPRDAHAFLANTIDRASVANLPDALKRVFQFEWDIARGKIPQDEVLGLFMRERGRDMRPFTQETPGIGTVRTKLEAVNQWFNVAGAGELGPRFQEFLNRMKQLGWPESRMKEELARARQAASSGKNYQDPIPWHDIQDAMEFANEVTTPFNRKGIMTAEINKIVPFFGPAVAGTAKSLRNWRENPKGAAIAMSVALGLRLLYWATFKDEPWYDQLSEHDKYNNFVLPIPGTDRIHRFPGPRGLDVPTGGLLTYVLDKAYEKNPDLPGLVRQSLGSNLPDWPVPPALMTGGQILANTNFMGSPIVPKKDERLPLANKIMQYQLPYALKQLTGGRGELSLSGTGVLPFPEVKSATRSVNQFYDRLDELEGEALLAKRRGLAFKEQDALARMRSASRQMADLNSRYQKADEEEKKRIRDKKIKLAKKALGQK